MGAQGSVLACLPQPYSDLPIVQALMEEGGLQDGVLNGAPSTRDSSPPPSLDISVLGPPAVDGLGELEAPHPYLVPLKCPLSSTQGREYGQYLEVLGFRLLLK